MDLPWFKGNLSESEQEQWSEKMGRSKYWVVWCRSRGKDEEQRGYCVWNSLVFSYLASHSKWRCLRCLSFCR